MTISYIISFKYVHNRAHVHTRARTHAHSFFLRKILSAQIGILSYANTCNCSDKLFYCLNLISLKEF
jgi:hypothetical protein